MHGLRRRSRRDENGFTLIELVLTVAIVGIIVVGLAGVVMSYLRNTVTTSARVNENHDVLLPSAYWQRDVASIGIRSSTYNNDPAVHSYAWAKSVNVTPSCALPSGTTVVTLAWSEYGDSTSPDTPTQTVTVTYRAQPSGSGYTLARIRCAGSTVTSSVVLAKQLNTLPQATCSGGGVAAGTDCSSYPAGKLPDLISMSLSIVDASSTTGTAYTATLTGDRRQT